MRKPLKWVANVLTGNDVTEWEQLPSGAKKMSIGIGWTAASDAPAGTFGIEISDHGNPSVAGVAYPIAITANPAGSAGSALLDNIETAASYIRMTYTRSSGGTGCVWTDDSGSSGTLPVLSIAE
jgi:hypothetical protein